MGRKHLLFFFLSLLGIEFASYAQSCPPNIDFELGSTVYWNYYTGFCCPISATTATPALPGRHTLTSGATTDPYGFFPTVAPGAAYSLKLGNNVGGLEAERARYYVHIPTGSTEYSLIYRYAVVLEDPTVSVHSVSQKPRFEVTASDSATGAPLPCVQHIYVASSSMTGFLPSTVPQGITFGPYDVIYKPWTTSTINLSGLGGTTVAVDFASGDCSIGGHFGYGYLDMSCGLFAISANVCDDTFATLTAPEGFASYTWYDSVTFTPVGSGRVTSIPQPAGTTTYAVVLQPYPGFGCVDTLYTRLTPSHLKLDVWGDTAICPGQSVLLQARGTDINIPLTYRWSPASSLSCSNCMAAYATVFATTIYTVTVTNSLGCTKTETVQVRILSAPPGVITHTDASCNGYNDGEAIVTPTSGTFPFIYNWTTSPIQTDSVADHLVAGTYTVTVTNSDGCSGDGVVTISQPPPTVISIQGHTNPTTCLGTDGTIVLEGLSAGQPFTISYLFNGVPQTATIIASSGGTATLSGLSAGTYSSITIIGTLCPYNVVGPLILTDPPPPLLPGVGSNSPVCLGSPLNLISACGTPGVTFSWSGPGGYSSPIQNPPAIDPAQYSDSGLYTVTVMINNCFSSDTTRVIIKPMPIPSASNNSPVCEGDSVMLFSSSSTGGTFYSWRGPNSFIASVQYPRIHNISVTAAGSYSVTVTLDGCSDTASTVVSVNPRPDAPIGFDTTYCQFAPSAPLIGVGTNLFWHKTLVDLGSPFAPIPSTTVPGTTTWYLSQEVGGCISQLSTVKVIIYDLLTPKLVLSDTIVCKGSYISFHTINPVAKVDDYEGITWFLGFGDSIKNVDPVVRSFDSVGTIIISAITLHKVCPDNLLSKIVKIVPYPVLHIGDDTSLCPGDQPITFSDFVNTGNRQASWIWNTGQTGPSITVAAPGSYHASITIDGCTTSDTVVLSNDCYLDIPNVFTPNGDNVNDYFFPRQLLTRGLMSFRMDIYNRWGQLVFTTSLTDGKGWDGTFNGVLQPEGVFVYTIDAVFKNNKKVHKQGNLTLLR